MIRPKTIRRLIKMNMWSQQDLANAMKVTSRTVTNWLRKGTSRPSSVRKLTKLISQAESEHPEFVQEEQRRAG